MVDYRDREERSDKVTMGNKIMTDWSTKFAEKISKAAKKEETKEVGDNFYVTERINKKMKDDFDEFIASLDENAKNGDPKLKIDAKIFEQLCNMDSKLMQQIH